MRRLLDCLVAVVLSPEMLVIVATVMIGCVFPGAVRAIGTRLSTFGESMKLLAAVPAALLALMIKDRDKLLFPSGRNSDALQEWPGYRMMSDRFYIGIWFEIGCVVVAISIWALGGSLATPRILCLFFGSLGVAVTTYAHFLHATFSVRHILATAGPCATKK